MPPAWLPTLSVVLMPYDSRALQLLLLLTVFVSGAVVNVGSPLRPLPVLAQDPSLPLSLQDYFGRLPKLHPGWTVGCQVTSLDERQPIYSLGGERRLTPGSVLKLATTYTALKVFGGAYRFPTEFFLDALPGSVGAAGERRVDFTEPVAGVGNLYVRGYGDPSIENSRVVEFAETLRALGVSSVQDIVVDDTLFVDPPRPSGERPHQAALGALSLGSNSYGVFVAPGALGQAATVSLTAGAPFRLTGKVRTARGRISNVEVRQNPSSSALPAGGFRSARELLTEKDAVQVTVEGVLGDASAGESFFFTVPDPGSYFGSVLRYYLKASGIDVKGVVRRGETPESARPLHTFESRELASLLADMNHASNNFYAGQIAYVLGQDGQGYFHGDLGLAKIRDSIGDLGVPAEQFDFRDASGLDHQSQISAQAVVEILTAAFHDRAIAPDFIASLSRFGLNGTLKSRSVLEPEYLHTLHGEELRSLEHRALTVWAKTGTLDKVSALAGLAESKNGEMLGFAILLSGDAPKEEFAKVEEEFVRLLIGAPAHYVPRQSLPGGVLPTPAGLPAGAGTGSGNKAPAGGVGDAPSRSIEPAEGFRRPPFSASPPEGPGLRPNENGPG